MPVLIRAETGGIIAGHCRILAAHRLGITEVPTVEAVGWSDNEVRAYILADNKLALNAGWDEALLTSELGDLQEFGFALDVIGFSDDELSTLVAEATIKGDPDVVPEPTPTPVSRPGDLWICGRHRVLCGDSTSSATTERLMAGEQADCCWTDPPYNVDYEGAAGKIQNDRLEAEAFAAFLLDAFEATFAMMKPGASIYVAHSETEALNFRAAFKAAGFEFSSCLIWRKNAFVLGRSDYQWQHEPVLYGWKPGVPRQWHGRRSPIGVANLDGTVFEKASGNSVTVRVGEQTLVIRGTDLTAEPVESTVIDIDRPRVSADHPTTKPVGLIERMLKNSTRPADLVLDPFGGSGSTLIACEQLSRSARLIEIDPRFVDVIVKRWQDYTGEAATLDGCGHRFVEAVTR